MSPPQHEITQLPRDWRAGDKSALDQLMPPVYDDLHRLASRRMAGSRQALKRGADRRIIELDEAMPAATGPAVDLADTVARDVQIATAWLQRELCREDRCGT